MNTTSTPSYPQVMEYIPERNYTEPKALYIAYADTNGKYTTHKYENEWISHIHNSSKIYRVKHVKDCDIEFESKLSELEKKGFSSYRENKYALRTFNGNVEASATALSIASCF
jgi:hypothetical protein